MEYIDVPMYNGLCLEVILDSIFASLATHSRVFDATESIPIVRYC